MSDQGVIALANGCVCCAAGDDMGDALHRIAGRTPPPDHVLIEASGVSDPWRIAQLALIEPGFDLQPLLVLADASALETQLADRWIADAVSSQFTYAELIVLTKTDLVDAATQDRLRRRLAELGPRARIVAGPVEEAALCFTPPPRARPSRLAADGGHGFITRTWSDPAPFDPAALRDVLGDLPASVLRVKGVCWLGPERAPHLLQYAAARWAFTPLPGAPMPGLVCIGTQTMPDPEAMFRPALRA